MLNSFHLNGHIIGFYPQIQKLEPPSTVVPLYSEPTVSLQPLIYPFSKFFFSGFFALLRTKKGWQILKYHVNILNVFRKRSVSLNVSLSEPVSSFLRKRWLF